MPGGQQGPEVNRAIIPRCSGHWRCTSVNYTLWFSFMLFFFITKSLFSIHAATIACFFFFISLTVSHSDPSVVATETATPWQRTEQGGHNVLFLLSFLSEEFSEAAKQEMFEVSKGCSNQIAESSQPPCLTPKSIRLSPNFSWGTQEASESQSAAYADVF